MKHLFDYIIEYLSTKDVATKPKDLKKRTDAPSDWEVGDILCGWYTYSGVIPYFYKIIEKHGTTFTLQRLKKELVSGFYNCEYTVTAGEVDKHEKPIKKRPNKYGRVDVGSGMAAVTLTLWDGKPLQGDGRN